MCFREKAQYFGVFVYNCRDTAKLADSLSERNP